MTQSLKGSCSTTELRTQNTWISYHAISMFCRWRDTLFPSTAIISMLTSYSGYCDSSQCASRINFMCLKAVMESSGEPYVWVERCFTSTSIILLPNTATISASPNLVRKLRCNTLYPKETKNCTATSSPRCPASVVFFLTMKLCLFCDVVKRFFDFCCAMSNAIAQVVQFCSSNIAFALQFEFND